MKNWALLLWFLVSSAALAPAQGTEILQKIDDQVTFLESDYSAQVVVVQDKPGEGKTSTTVALFRRDKEVKYLLLVLSPENEKGKGYLKVGNNLWLYDPTARRFTVTSAKDRFQNSNARNSDFTQSSLAKDYRIVSSKAEKLGRFDTTVHSLEAIHPDVAFPKTKIWVTADNLVRKTEDYSLSGQLLRTTAIPSYQKVGSRYVPVSLVIVDELKGKTINGVFYHERTQITMSKPSLDPLPDMVFTQAYLERMGR